MKSLVVVLLFGVGCLSPISSASSRMNEDRRVSPRSTGLTKITKQTGHAWSCNKHQDVTRTPLNDYQQLKERTPANRFKRYTTDTKGQDWKWTKLNLTYHFNSYTPDLSRADQRDAIQRAFHLWANVSALSFTESSRSSADIVIDFVRGRHGDGRQAAFDGEGGNLAHGFFPPVGDIHFDDDETFSMTSEDGVNLYILAAHEIGHSLGLAHSNDSTALMYHKIAFWRTFDELPEDDVKGIQYLYGKPGDGGVDGGDPNVPACDSHWDAATYYAPDNVVYAFRGHHVWAINDKGVMQGYPNMTNRVFIGAPSDVQAAVSSGNRTYMFRGKKIWRFNAKELEAGFPRLKPKGFPALPDAAVLWGGSSRIFVFRGARFYEFFEHNLTVNTPEYISQHLRGIPSMMDAALTWGNGKTYFFKGNKYWRFNDRKVAAAKGYPKSRSENWMGCGLPEDQYLPPK